MRRFAPIIVAAAVLAAGVSSAHGADTRAEYVAQVDRICRAGQLDMRAEAKKHRAPLKRIGAELENGAGTINRKREVALLGEFARRSFAPTLQVFPRVTDQISAVAPAPTDATAVSGWLGARRAYLRLIKRSVEVAQRGASKKQNFLIEKATSVLVEGEIPVENFGFRFCLLSSSQD